MKSGPENIRAKLEHEVRTGNDPTVCTVPGFVMSMRLQHKAEENTAS